MSGKYVVFWGIFLPTLAADKLKSIFLHGSPVLQRFRVVGMFFHSNLINLKFKIMHLKHLLITAVVGFSSFPLVAQSNATDEWKLLKTENNVSVFAETGSCRNSEVVFLKVVNSNSQTVEVQWSLLDNTTMKKVSLKPGESFSGDCSNRMPMVTLKESLPQGKKLSDLHLKLDVQIVK